MKQKYRELAIKLLLLGLIALTFMPSFQEFKQVQEVQIAYADEVVQPAPEPAPEPAPATPKTKAPSELEGAVNLISTIQDVLSILLWPVIFLIGNLMDNGLLFGGGMGQRLQEIWILIRNIINILFVIVLLAIALYNVLGLGDENSNYSIKAVLPKVIVGIIVVNFSFFGMKVFLDGINVLSSAIFALPNQVDQNLAYILSAPGSELSEEEKEIERRLCNAINRGEASDLDKRETEEADRVFLENHEANLYIKVLARSYSKQVTLKKLTYKKEEVIELARAAGIDISKLEAEVENVKKSLVCVGRQFTDFGRSKLAGYNSNNAALAMAINSGKILFYRDVPLNTDYFEKLVINSFFSMILYLAYAASFLALFAVLLARLIVLWLAIAMSPLLLLIMFVPEIKEKMGEFGNLGDKVIKNAIAPILIALPMSIGWIMLQALSTQGFNNTNGFSWNEGGVPVVGVESLQDFIVAIATIGVVWLGVFSAASETLAGSLTNWLKEKVQGAAKYVGTLPLKYTPFIPVKLPGDKGVKSFTPFQVSTAYSDLQRQMLDPNELSRDLGLIGGYAPSSLKEARTGEQMASYLLDPRRREDFLKWGEPMQKEMSESTEQLKIIAADMKRNKDDDVQEAGRLLDAYANGQNNLTNRAHRNTILDGLDKLKSQTPTPPTPATTTPPTPAPAPAANPQPQPPAVPSQVKTAQTNQAQRATEFQRLQTTDSTFVSPQEAAALAKAEVDVTVAAFDDARKPKDVAGFESLLTPFVASKKDGKKEYVNGTFEEIIKTDDTRKKLDAEYQNVKTAQDPETLKDLWDTLKGKPVQAPSATP